MTKTRVSLGIFTGFALGMSLLLGIGFLSVRSTNDQEETAQCVDHTYQVRLALDQLLRSVVEAQNGRRGYVISNDARFLPPFEASVARIGATFDSLQEQTADNPLQQGRLRAIAPLLRAQIGYLRQSIEWARGGASNAAAQRALTESSRVLFEDLSHRVGQMTSTETLLLAERKALARRSAERGRAIVLAGTIAALVVLLAVFSRLWWVSAARARSEARAIASEARFAGILDIAEDAIISFDESTKILLYNQGAESIFGYAPKEALGASLDLLIPPRARTAPAGGASRAALTAERMNATHEIIGLRRDGTEFPAEVSVTRLEQPGERVYTAILRDVSRRKRLEQERDRYFALSADLMCVAGTDGYFKRLNPAWERTLGWTIEELTARPFLDFVHPDDRPSTVAESERTIRSGRVSGFRNRYRCKDGSYRWLAWTSPGMAPGATDIYAAARDVTEEILAQQQISELNRELETRAAELADSNKELDAFCYSISHDMRAPLRAIGGFSRIVTEEYAGALDEEGVRLLGKIAENTDRMGQLIDDLLSFSRLGRQTMRRTPIQMQELVESVARELVHAASPRRIVVTIGTLPEAPADAAMLRQVWVNLLSNAVKYTKGRETAAIEVTGSLEGEDAVYAVKDNGIGFEMQYAHKLFGVFQRLHSASEFEGTGVGLALVQRIVARHGGRIRGEGRPDQGATFTFTLPRTVPGEDNPDRGTERRKEPAHA